MEGNCHYNVVRQRSPLTPLRWLMPNFREGDGNRTEYTELEPHSKAIPNRTERTKEFDNRTRTELSVVGSFPTVSPFTADPVKALHFTILV